MQPRLAICVFAKPPVPGATKTRLGAHVGAVAAAELAWAFVQDTWAAVSALPWAQAVLATTEAHADLLALVGSSPLWLQGSGDLGARMETIAARALSAGFSGVIEIGSDSPGLPLDRLEQAAALLQTHEAVMGRSDDGGFFLLGLNVCPPGLLAALPWSHPDTATETKARLLSHDLRVAETAGWFDVDDYQDLQRLERLIMSQHVTAPATAAALLRLNVTTS